MEGRVIPRDWREKEPYMSFKDLQPKIDYIFREECQEHVPCIRLECERCSVHVAWANALFAAAS